MPLYVPAAAGGGADETWDFLILPVSQRPFSFANDTISVSANDALWTNSQLVTDNATQNATMRWKVLLAAGTWTIRYLYGTANNDGIHTLALDGVSVGTVDGYDAAGANNLLAVITGIVVASTGVKNFDITTATKNASSGFYRMRMQAIQFQRTA